MPRGCNELPTPVETSLVPTQEGELWIMIPPDAETLCCVAGAGWLPPDVCARCEFHRGRMGVFGQGIAYKCGWLGAAAGQMGLAKLPSVMDL